MCTISPNLFFKSWNRSGVMWNQIQWWTFTCCQVKMCFMSSIVRKPDGRPEMNAVFAVRKSGSFYASKICLSAPILANKPNRGILYHKIPSFFFFRQHCLMVAHSTHPPPLHSLPSKTKPPSRIWNSIRLLPEWRMPSNQQVSLSVLPNTGYCFTKL
jgi:hypothetical protein